MYADYLKIGAGVTVVEYRRKNGSICMPTTGEVGPESL